MADDDDELPEGDLDDEGELEDDLDDEDIDLEEGDLDEELEDDLDEELDDDLSDDGELDEDADDEDVAPAPKVVDEEADEDDLEDLDPDDVEADLDTILKDRIAAADDEEEDEDEPADPEDRADGNRLQPRRPGEFVCQSCFLLKPHTQLADSKLQYCLDCV